MSQRCSRVLVSASVGRRHSTLLAVGDGAMHTLESPRRATGDFATPVRRGTLRSFIGATSEGFTALAGFLASGATTVDVVDSQGNRVAAEVNNGAWAAVLCSTDERDFEPLVEFFAEDGALVDRLDRVPTFDERVAEMLASHDDEVPSTHQMTVRFGQAPLVDEPPAGLGESSIHRPVSSEAPSGVILLHSRAATDRRAALGDCKLGGRPDLPAGVAWPTLGGHVLAFIAQIDLDALPGESLPSPGWAGMLAIFCAVDPDSGTAGDEVVGQHGGCRLLRFPKEHLARAEWPDQLDPDLHYDEVLIDAASTASGATNSADGPRHRLFGDPDPIQEDVLAEIAAIQADASGDTDEPWDLLIQIDEDPATGFEWGDAGRLYIALRRADLSAGIVDRAFALSQSN